MSARTGWIVILNGAPCSGKSSIAAVVQDTFDGIWMNLGVDIFARQVTPPRLRPGMGLRPGGGRPDIEGVITRLYAAFYDSLAAHSRHGLNVVADVGHHDAYTIPAGTLGEAARRLDGLPAFLVGVHCPVEVIMQRRARRDSSPGWIQGQVEGGSIPDAVARWQEEVHRPGIYDLSVDTSTMSPEQCAEAIRERLVGPPPSALASLCLSQS